MSWYTYNRYVWKKNYKVVGGNDSLKHHVLLTLNGCPVASAVTDGDRDYLPMLTRLTGTASCGNRYLSADRKYCCQENCEETVCVGRLFAYDIQRATPDADFAREAT